MNAFKDKNPHLFTFFDSIAKKHRIALPHVILLSISCCSAITNKFSALDLGYTIEENVLVWLLSMDWPGSSKTSTMSCIKDAVEDACREEDVPVYVSSSNFSIPALLREMESHEGLAIIIPDEFQYFLEMIRNPEPRQSFMEL
jgi:hypothetical protein